MSETERRTIRLDDRWDALRDIAAHRGCSITRVIKDLVDPAIADFYAAAPLQERIPIAYTRLAKGPKDWVPLADLRWWLADVGRQVLDQTLLEMNRAGVVRLAPLLSRARITQDDHNAALSISTVDNHVFRVDDPPASSKAE